MPKENYKLKKILVIYNLYTNNLNQNILNCKNKIIASASLIWKILKIKPSNFGP